MAVDNHINKLKLYSLESIYPFLTILEESFDEFVVVTLELKQWLIVGDGFGAWVYTSKIPASGLLLLECKNLVPILLN